MSAKGFKPGDVVALIRPSGEVEFVRVAKGNSRRVVSYLIPGRVKPIAAKPDYKIGNEFCTIAEFPEAAARLYDAGTREFPDVVAARRAVQTEAEIADL
jgi:hypothetical protein